MMLMSEASYQRYRHVYQFKDPFYVPWKLALDFHR